MAEKFIDAEKAKYLLIEKYDCHCPNTINGELIRKGIYESSKVLNDMPAAEVEPVRHSKWVADVGEYYCARCKYEMQYVTPYCPKCGCKMDGENNDT